MEPQPLQETGNGEEVLQETGNGEEVGVEVEVEPLPLLQTNVNPPLRRIIRGPTYRLQHESLFRLTAP